jgi:ectoine hydroxylase-related dioxygenase (phytanoyl-CoA dioxygenase family)
MERVDELAERLGVLPIEMAPGDGLFFHANLLHRSDQNRSDKSRWSMICCYNAASNNPYKDSHHPRYTPLQIVPDAAILEVGHKRFQTESTDLGWLVDQADQSARSLDS